MKDILIYYGLNGLLVLLGMSIATILASAIDEFLPLPEVVTKLVYVIYFFLLWIVPYLAHWLLTEIYEIEQPGWRNNTRSITDEDIQGLQDAVLELQDVVKKQETLTVKELREFLNNKLLLFEKFQRKAVAQEKEIRQMEHLLEIERRKAEEVTRLTRQVATIGKDELETLKLLVTEDAKNQTTKSFVWGIVIFFPIGVITSLVAIPLYRRIIRNHTASHQ